jgi:hypothetical protein
MAVVSSSMAGSRQDLGRILRDQAPALDRSHRGRLPDHRRDPDLIHPVRFPVRSRGLAPGHTHLGLRHPHLRIGEAGGTSTR